MYNHFIWICLKSYISNPRIFCYSEYLNLHNRAHVGVKEFNDTKCLSAYDIFPHIADLVVDSETSKFITFLRLPGLEASCKSAPITRLISLLDSFLLIFVNLAKHLRTCVWIAYAYHSGSVVCRQKCPSIFILKDCICILAVFACFTIQLTQLIPLSLIVYWLAFLIKETLHFTLCQMQIRQFFDYEGFKCLVANDHIKFGSSLARESKD